MNKNKGFTLIELLVVIAIIGILSSVVLASLTSARTKAKVAAVQSTLSSMRAQAEIGMTSGKYVINVCTAPATTGGLSSLMASLNLASSKATGVICGQDTVTANAPYKWAAEASINGLSYCADSSGYSGLSKGTGASSAITAGFASGDLDCRS